MSNDDIRRYKNAVQGNIDIDSVFQQMMRDAPERHRVYVEAYREVMDDCIKLVGQRNDEDYNQMVALPDYFPFAEYSYGHMLFLKCMRAINQIMAGAKVADSLEDLINYAAFTAAWYRLREEGQVPEITYGPAAGGAQERRADMEKELFQGGQGRVTEDTKLIGGETNPTEEDIYDAQVYKRGTDVVREEGIHDRDIEEYLKDEVYGGPVPSPEHIRSYLERRGIPEAL